MGQILKPNEKLNKIMDFASKVPCYNGNNHTWSIAPIIDISIQAMCVVCDTEIGVSLVTEMIYDKANP